MSEANLSSRGFSIRNALFCVRCGRDPGPKAGYIPKPVDRHPPGVRCGRCYRLYLRSYFPEALPAKLNLT